jgi:enoyl-CoA hydratase
MATDVGQQVVRVEENDGVLRVTMDRPPANALGAPLVEGLDAALDALESSEAEALVITSAVPGLFAAGADIKQMLSSSVEDFANYRDALRVALERLARCGRPSIAAIDGIALGGGLELAMACTLRFATPASRLGLPEVRLGLIPGAGGTQRLPLLVGRGRALELMLSGRDIGAEDASLIGLVDRVVEGDVVEEAVAFARRLMEMPGDAVGAIIACVDAAVPVSDAGMACEGEAVLRMFLGDEAQRALAAFVDKRRTEAG